MARDYFKNPSDCPSCGAELIPFQDLLGAGFSCHEMDCMETFDYDEIVEPEPVAATVKDTEAKMWDDIAKSAATA